VKKEMAMIKWIVTGLEIMTGIGPLAMLMFLSAKYSLEALDAANFHHEGLILFGLFLVYLLLVWPLLLYLCSRTLGACIVPHIMIRRPIWQKLKMGEVEWLKEVQKAIQHRIDRLETHGN
jgi:hypothetical protein